MPTTFTFEFGLGFAAGTGSAAAAAVLPLLPLDVRIWLPYESGTSDGRIASTLAAVEAEFDAARAFWLHYASIDLRLWRGKVDVIPDAVALPLAGQAGAPHHLHPAGKLPADP